ncbi:hypothetical protein Tco_0596201 [Tanacetum coccineum]
MASKDAGGLGVASLFALNRGLLFKWVWRFITQKNSLWAKVITAIHGDDGQIGKTVKPTFSSIWLNIIQEVAVMKLKGIDVTQSRGAGEQIQMDLKKSESCILSDTKGHMDVTRWVKEVSIRSTFSLGKVSNEFTCLPDSIFLVEIMSKILRVVDVGYEEITLEEMTTGC